MPNILHEYLLSFAIFILTSPLWKDISSLVQLRITFQKSQVIHSWVTSLYEKCQLNLFLQSPELPLHSDLSKSLEIKTQNWLKDNRTVLSIFALRSSYYAQRLQKYVNWIVLLQKRLLPDLRKVGNARSLFPGLAIIELLSLLFFVTPLIEITQNVTMSWSQYQLNIPFIFPVKTHGLQKCLIFIRPSRLFVI